MVVVTGEIRCLNYGIRLTYLSKVNHKAGSVYERKQRSECPLCCTFAFRKVYIVQY